MLDFREVDPFFQRSHWGPQKGPISTIADDFWTFEIHNWKETIQGQLASISFASFFVCLFVCLLCLLVGWFVCFPDIMSNILDCNLHESIS